MTPRERMFAAGRGGLVDQAPRLAADWSADADAWAVPADQVAAARAERPDAVLLAWVANPFARARTAAPDLAERLREDPQAGGAIVDRLRLEAMREAEAAFDAGADGIVYFLDGAFPAASTPMEYGGWYLEADRAVLTAVSDSHLNLVYVAGNEPYLDFVADLPGTFLGWDAATGPGPEAVRRIRLGAVALDHPDANLRLPGALSFPNA